MKHHMNIISVEMLLLIKMEMEMLQDIATMEMVTL